MKVKTAFVVCVCFVVALLAALALLPGDASSRSTPVLSATQSAGVDTAVSQTVAAGGGGTLPPTPKFPLMQEHRPKQRPPAHHAHVPKQPVQRDRDAAPVRSAPLLRNTAVLPKTYPVAPPSTLHRAVARLRDELHSSVAALRAVLVRAAAAATDDERKLETAAAPTELAATTPQPERLDERERRKAQRRAHKQQRDTESTVLAAPPPSTTATQSLEATTAAAASTAPTTTTAPTTAPTATVHTPKPKPAVIDLREQFERLRGGALRTPIPPTPKPTPLPVAVHLDTNETDDMFAEMRRTVLEVPPDFVPAPFSLLCRGCFSIVASKKWCRCCQLNCGGCVRSAAVRSTRSRATHAGMRAAIAISVADSRISAPSTAQRSSTPPSSFASCRPLRKLNFGWPNSTHEDWTVKNCCVGSLYAPQRLFSTLLAQRCSAGGGDGGRRSPRLCAAQATVDATTDAVAQPQSNAVLERLSHIGLANKASQKEIYYDFVLASSQHIH